MKNKSKTYPNGFPMIDVFPPQVEYVMMMAGGGETPSEQYYRANAKLAYYKEKLNNKLKAKNPKAFQDYFKGLVDLRRSGKTADAEKYVQETAYNEFLSPDEVRKELADQYEDYLNSLQEVNSYNVKQGRQPLYGSLEGEQDINNLNYGRRFASLMVTPSFSYTNETRGTSYTRNYAFDPTKGISFTEQGDPSLNPYKDVTKMDDGGFINPFAQTVNNVARKVNGIQQTMMTGLLDQAINPFSISNVLGTTSDIVSAFGEQAKIKRDRQWARDQMQANNVFAVNPGGDRGDYVTTGTSYGMFRPDQMGAKSPDGMYRGMYYPSMADGGNFADKYQVDSIDSIIDSGIPAEMMSSIAIGPSVDPMTQMPTYESNTPVVSKFKNHAIVSTKPVSINDSTRKAYEYYTKEKALPSHIAAGIVGNLYQESRLDTGAVEKTNTANGRGIAQWDVRNRWKGLLNWAQRSGRDPYDLKTQLDYVLVEPGEGSRALEKLKNTTTPEQAAVVFGRIFERPSEKHANWSVRASVANKLHSGQFADGGEPDPKKRAKNRKDIFSPIADKVYGAWEMSSKNGKTPLPVIEEVLSVYGALPTSDGVSQMTGVHYDNPAPLDPTIQEIQKKINKLPTEKLSELLSYDWSKANVFTGIKKATSAGISLGEAYKYYKHFMKLKEQGFTFEEGGNVDPKEFYNSYINSPEYRKRLERMDYEDVDGTVTKRSSNITKAKIVNQDGAPGLLQQFVNKVTGEPYSTQGSKYSDGTVIFDQAQAKRLKNSKNSTLAHELGHAELDGAPLNARENKEILKRIVNSGSKSKHDLKPEENKADINALRYELQQQGLYNPGTESMSKDILKKAKSSFTKDRLLKNFKEDDLVWLMNNIAATSATDIPPLAENGGEKYGLLKKAFKDAKPQPLTREQRAEQIANGSPWNINDYHQFGLPEPGLESPPIDPIDFVGAGLGAKAVLKAGSLYKQALKPNVVRGINIGSHPKTIARTAGALGKASGYLSSDVLDLMFGTNNNYTEGKYEAGGEMELTEAEIKFLKSQGYNIEYL